MMLKLNFNTNANIHFNSDIFSVSGVISAQK